jgi:hypothetical protein
MRRLIAKGCFRKVFSRKSTRGVGNQERRNKKSLPYFFIDVLYLSKAIRITTLSRQLKRSLLLFSWQTQPETGNGGSVFAFSLSHKDYFKIESSGR